MADRCFYFGCWNESGHYLFGPGGDSGNSRTYAERDRLCQYGADRVHIDGTLAPRRIKRGTHEICRITGKTWGDVVWQGMGATREHRDRIGYDSEECPQGEFLLHKLSTGFTVIQWWDRCQGDRRGACNSTVMLEGNHTSVEMVEALATHFPHVLANLTKAGVKLVEVQIPSTGV